MDLIVYIAIGYGIGVAHEVFLKKKTLNDSLLWPQRMLARLQRWIAKQKAKADDTTTEPKE